MTTARNFAKPFSIAGFILGEVYMALLCLAPYRQGPPARLPMGVELPIPPSPLPPGTAIPTDALIWKMIASSIFFGPFGALVGMGIGLLIGGLMDKIWPLPDSAPPAPPVSRQSASHRADSAPPQS